MRGIAWIRDKIDGISQEELKARLDYNPETGMFKWKFRALCHFKSESNFKTWNAKFANKEAGHLDSQGYRNINIDYRIYKAHRLAYCYMTGKYPDGKIIHNNGVKGDNKWSNIV